MPTGRRLLRVVACFAIVLGNAIAPAHQPDPTATPADAEASRVKTAIALLESAHASTAPFEVRIRYAGMIGGGISRADVARIPGATILERGDPPVELFAVREGVLTCDGADGMRLESRYIAARVGNPHTSAEVWTATENAVVPTLEAETGVTVRAELYRIKPTTQGERAAAYQGYLWTYERRRAVTHYLPMARHVAVVLSEDPETRVLAATDDAIHLESPGAGMQAIVDRKSGALRRVRFADIRGGTTDYEFNGVIDGPGFPAAHPAEVVIRYPGGSTAAELYSDYRAIPAPDPEQFTWQSIAFTAFDPRSGEQFWAEKKPTPPDVMVLGTTSTAATTPVPPVPSPNIPANPTPGGSTTVPLSPILLLLGLIAAAAVIGIISIFRPKK